jgi:hypothetical protein
LHLFGGEFNRRMEGWGYVREVVIYISIHNEFFNINDNDDDDDDDSFYT